MRLSVCREAERTYSLFHSSSIGQIKLLTADEAPQAALTCGMRDLEDRVAVVFKLLAVKRHCFFLDQDSEPEVQGGSGT
jgi:hypothetical protein